MTNTVEIMSIELVIVSDPFIKIVQSIGSVLHGVLMKFVGTDYAGQLHEAGLRPYSQYVYFDKGRKQYIQSSLRHFEFIVICYANGINLVPLE